jgi:hypothetical protein
MASDDMQPMLASSVAGPPRTQAFLLRHLLFPFCCRCLSWKRADAVFQVEGKKLVRLTEALPGKLLSKEVLIGRLVGIEDDERCWSAEMVLEHLIDSGTVFAECIVQLSKGEKPAAGIVDVAAKPEGGKGIEVWRDYRDFLGDFAGTLSEDVHDRRSRTSHPHPWLGELTAHRWHCLAAVHQTVHRRQMERIVAGLGGR